MDLRLKFGMDSAKYTKETCIIVVEVGPVQMGVLVDTVSEVLDITEDEIEPPPAFGGAIKTDFILGMGKIKGAVKILLEIDKVMSINEIQLGESLSENLEN